MTDQPEKPLFIPLKLEYFDAFAAGTKNEEYRRFGVRWNGNTCRVGRAVVLSRGYGRKHRLAGRIVAFSTWPVFELPWEAREAFMKCYGAGSAYVAAIKIELDREKE